MICVSLGELSKEMAIEAVRKYDFVEIRADLLDLDREDLSALLKLAGKGVFTFRPEYADDDKRMELFRMAVSYGVEYLDIELESQPKFLQQILALVKNSQTRLIISYHDFEGTPGKHELESILRKCYQLGADTAKIATLVESEKDILSLFSLYDIPGSKVILGMGDFGLITRVAAVPMGSEFSFAYPDESRATAPGQLSYREMMDINSILGVKEK